MSWRRLGGSAPLVRPLVLVTAFCGNWAQCSAVPLADGNVEAFAGPVASSDLALAASVGGAAVFTAAHRRDVFRAARRVRTSWAPIFGAPRRRLVADSLARRSS